MSDDVLLLSNQICFLVHRLDQRLVQRYRPLLEPLGLTYPQYLAMLVLWEERDVPVGRLCERLGVDSGTISPLVKRLAAAGLVEKARDAGDERSVRVRLTGRGLALREEALGVPGALVSCFRGQPVDVGRFRADLLALLEQLEGAARCGSEEVDAEAAHHHGI